MSSASDIPSPVLETLADLIRINSVNPNYTGGVGEGEIAAYVSQFFSQRKIETWCQDLFPGRSNVLARIPGRENFGRENFGRENFGRVVLEAHLDTVSGAGMTIDPWTPRVIDGKMYGRGACDTKGGMAAMMHAMAGLVQDGLVPPCEIVFAATIDEEFSYRGVVAVCNSLDAGPVDPGVLMEHARPANPISADAAIVAEPTDLRLVTASKGLVRWKIECTGRSAHSAKPDLGVNAIEHMAEIVSAIRADNLALAHRVHPLLGPATCNVGIISGGTQVNFVPDRCEIEIDRRMLPQERTEAVLEHYQLLIDQVAAGHPDMQVVMHPPMLTDKPLETARSAAAVVKMGQILGSMGLESSPAGVPFCSDASKFGAIGIPTMIFGPGSIDQAHAAIEYVPCDEVIRAAEVYRRFMLEFRPR